jgi:hypothetical protein
MFRDIFGSFGKWLLWTPRPSRGDRDRRTDEPPPQRASYDARARHYYRAKPGHVAAARDGSHKAVRGICDAMPILFTAISVDLLTDYMHGATDQEDAASMIDHLAHHGVTTRRGGQEASIAQEHPALQAVIREVAYDPLVMGAYSDDRLMEIIFGCAIKTTLMTTNIPIQVSH